jgi:hypothetical protein
MTRGTFQVAHECPLDPKWLLIGRVCDVEPLLVSGVWLALLGHASAACPRGSIASFDVDSLAAFNGCPAERLAGVIREFRARNMITPDDRLRTWAKRQGLKTDATNAVRQKRHRDRKRNAVTGVTEGEGVTPVTRNAGGVTPSNDRYEKGGDIRGGSALDPASASSIDPTTTNLRGIARALAREEVIKALDQAKAGGGIAWTFRGSKHLEALIAARVTGRELHDAIERARAKRKAEGSSQAVNVGLVASMLGDVRANGAGASTSNAPRSAAGNSPEVPDDPVEQAKAHAHDRVYRFGDWTLEQGRAYVDEIRAKYAAKAGAP